MTTAIENRKLDGLRELLRRHNAGGILITTTANFAWLTGGGWNGVRNSSDIGAAFLLVTAAGRHLVTNNIEAPRIETEELHGAEWSVARFPWHERSPIDVAATLAGSGPILSDSGLFGTVNVEGEVSPMRWTLDQDECGRIRQAGRIAGDAVATAARLLKPGMTEHEAAALMAREVMARGAFPTVTLVGSDERISRFRHPVASRKRIEKTVMLVIGVRLAGLNACCTRIVNFGSMSSDLRRRHHAVCRVDAALMNATRPGTTLGDCFATAMAAYASEGFPDEWMHHHQGGIIGYQTREVLAKPNLPVTIVAPQAFAWNPTITGTKSEDTILVERDGQSVLTASSGWPSLDIEVGPVVINRPDILCIT